MQRGGGTIRTPDQRLRVFISSTIGELAQERDAVDTAVRSLRLIPVRFELGARPHRPDDLYRAYLEQSDIFVGIYWQSYGWVAPGATISGVEDELRRRGDRPCLIYVKEPAPEREARAREPPRAAPRRGWRDVSSLRLVGRARRARPRRCRGSGQRALPRRGRRRRRSFPTGTVSFLFVDIDGSTALARRRWGTPIRRSRRRFDHSCATQPKEAAARSSTPTATVPSVRSRPWRRPRSPRSRSSACSAAIRGPLKRSVRARMGIHTGAATRTANGYAGIEVHRAARIGAAANGGQILVSRPAVELLERPRLRRRERRRPRLVRTQGPRSDRAALSAARAGAR